MREVVRDAWAVQEKVGKKPPLCRGLQGSEGNPQNCRERGLMISVRFLKFNLRWKTGDTEKSWAIAMYQKIKNCFVSSFSWVGGSWRGMKASGFMSCFFGRDLWSKKSPTGPHVSRTPKQPEYLIAGSQLTWSGSVGIWSHSILMDMIYAKDLKDQRF